MPTAVAAAGLTGLALFLGGLPGAVFVVLLALTVPHSAVVARLDRLVAAEPATATVGRRCPGRPRDSGRMSAAPYAWLTAAALPVTSESVEPLLRAAQQAGALDLPLPGSGRTLERWHSLAELASVDLVLGRLVEAHADAAAILAELDGPVAEGLWGVWAAEPPTARVEARRTDAGWRLSGRKAWCSGASVLDRALVTAHAGQERRLFAIDVADAALVPGTWAAVGMAASGSVSIDLTDVRAEPVGGPGGYLDRPGFWHGGAGVAACWYGGALGAARTLLAAARATPRDPHALAHLGAVDALVAGLAAHLAVAAGEIDADPAGAQARQRAVRLRARVEAGATEVL
ncbi:MAG: hypothetical protein M3Z02_12710, partial [Actinomycetota bacterium]|nr:hypothetical protein [Actinomycetota bacterium]